LEPPSRAKFDADYRIERAGAQLAKQCAVKGAGLQRVKLPPGKPAWLSVSRREAALALNPKPAFGFRSTANPVLLPEAKPRTISEHFVVPSIRSREVTRVQRSGSGTAKVRSNHSMSAIVCSASIRPNIRHGRGNRQTERTCAFPQWPVGAIPPVRIGAYGGSEQLSGEG
jgi:hypothetical protein